MHFQHVYLEGMAYEIPNEIVTSADLERELRPLYERLRLPEGRLAAMTGVHERRFWPSGTLPSQISLRTAEKLLQQTGIDRDLVGVLIHGSVCRDHLEPATACAVHHGLQLSSQCIAFDLSNACLGLLSGVVQMACMIELGVIRAGIVVGTEGGRQLVETTVQMLNQDTTLTRQSIKTAIASLTIGSGSCAMLLVHRDLSRSGHHLSHSVTLANTQHHALCQSGADEAVASGMAPIMHTDAETLMREGIATGRRNFDSLLCETGWSRSDIDKTICHQVGTVHQRLLFESLELDPVLDFTTLQWLGNTGSVALPMTLAIAAEQGHLIPKDRVALMGIGSGINSIMLACQW